MFGTLYAALVMHSYIMSLVCCALQVSCLMSRPFALRNAARPVTGKLHIHMLVSAAFGASVLCGFLLPWRNSGGKVCADDGYISLQTMYVRHQASSHGQVGYDHAVSSTCSRSYI